MSEKSLPLSPMQTGMLFHAITVPGAGVDMQHIVMTLHEKIDQALFQQAWEILLSRHEILRTTFEWENVEFPCQVVHNMVSLNISCHDWQSLDSNAQNVQLKNFVAEDRKAGFELSKSSAFRVNLFQMDADLFKCVWAFHHIILDGRSFTIILDELFTIYDALFAGESYVLPERRPFSDYLDWYLGKDFSQSESYWRKLLTEFTAPTPLTIAKQAKHDTHVATASAETEIRIPAAAVQELAQFAARIGVTMNTLVQGAWGLAWRHYSNEMDVVFGATRACRYGLDGLLEMVGNFINTLPIRAQINSETTLADYLQNIREQHVAVRPHEHTPLADVQKWSDVSDGASLFNTLVVFERYDLNANMREKGGAWLNRHFVYKGQTNFPLTLMAYHHDELILRLEYDPAYFETAVMARLLQHLQQLLTAMPTNQDKKALTLPYLTEAERTQILDQWNPDYDLEAVNAPIHQFIEAQVAKTPEKTAVTFQSQTLTYQQLNEKANQLAHFLQTQNVKPGTFVGICLRRSLNTIISLLGVLKAGATYIPLDPQYPRERLAHMINDSQMPLLIVETAVIDHLPESSTTILNIDQISVELAGFPTTNPAKTAALDDLAYVIYTSGSTGKPKGVKVPHRGLTNFIQSMAKEPGMTADDVLVAVTTISFDIHGLEMFLPLFVGGTLVIVGDETTVDGHGLAQLIDLVEGTIMQATPATWQMLLDAKWNGRFQLKMLCGGEPLPRRLADKLLAKGSALWNMYGPTETTIWSTISKIEPGDVPITIGRPIANTSVYILDEQLQQTPVGIIGELCIGGAGVTHGYLNRDELTQDRFLPNPYRTGDTIYKTGDLARYNFDGTLDCLGRIDNQVKIRGFRIELGEIESVVTQHSAVQEAVVVAQTTPAGNKQLVGYVIPKSGSTPKVSDLRNFAKTKLPDYMVPATFITLGAFPLTANGKINRLALPKPDGERPDLGNMFVPPRTPAEKKLAAIWEDILLVNNIGVNDSFFDLGGDSLLIVRVLNKIRNNFQSHLAVHDLFQYRTIRTLAEHLTESNGHANGKETREIDDRASKRRNAVARQKNRNLARQKARRR